MAWPPPRLDHTVTLGIVSALGRGAIGIVDYSLEVAKPTRCDASVSDINEWTRERAVSLIQFERGTRSF
jgi:hypothetical protein